MTLRFSIVLPTFNGPPELLERQLRAVSEQDHREWECIVIDDGSDATTGIDVVERFVASDPRFRLLRRATNGGIAAATNDGVAAATGSWIVFCDHDDVIHRRALGRIAEHIAANPLDDVVYTDERIVDDDGRPLQVYRKPDFSPERLLGQNYFCHIVAVRRSLVDEVGPLDPAFGPIPDRDFNLRAATAARHVGQIRGVNSPAARGATKRVWAILLRHWIILKICQRPMSTRGLGQFD
jgi:glycosyltransferase involved in cell wall biosynthesis